MKNILTPAWPVLFVALAFAITGCVSNRYLEAKKGTPQPQLLDVAFPANSGEATLKSVITFNGPGSWKRDALWDEYVVTLHNPGSQALTLTDASLTDYAGTGHAPGIHPWNLEKESQAQEQKHRAAGVAFVRYTAPGVIIAGTGALAISSAGVLTAAGSAAATATFVALPLYYLGVLYINDGNKDCMEAKFQRRRLELSLTLAPGETRTGSLFFVMTPSPRSLSLHWSSGPASSENLLPLDFLHGLHVQASGDAHPKS